VGALVDLELSPAVRQHLGHERHTFVLAVVVECSKDFVFAPYLHPVANPGAPTLPSHNWKSFLQQAGVDGTPHG
jgi:hypothetical protein